jgi:hypothetical protein
MRPRQCPLAAELDDDRHSAGALALHGKPTARDRPRDGPRRSSLDESGRTGDLANRLGTTGDTQR